MFKINCTYKLKTDDGIYTATIKKVLNPEGDALICFVDKNNVDRGIKSSKIQEFREVF